MFFYFLNMGLSFAILQPLQYFNILKSGIQVQLKFQNHL